MSHAYVVTHTDLDGVGAAAALLRVLGKRRGDGATVLYSEPYELHEVLRSLSKYVERGDLVAVTDLGLNEEMKGETKRAVRELAKRARVEFYDHHVWDGEDIGGLLELGASLYIDRSTCATGVVVNYATRSRGMEPDQFLRELELAVCSADLWRWDHPLSPRLYRAVGAREEGREWRDRVLDKFVDGKLWDEELERRVEQYMDEELRRVSKALDTVFVTEKGGIRVAFAVKEEGPPANGIIAAILMSRYDAHVAGIMRPNGGLSLRSRKVDVQKIATKLGGGGHARAAGARIKIPFFISLLSEIYPKALAWYGAKRVLEQL
ncbi:MAG: DHHA1 domain-containing protein [Acidilobaceae archaeon]|nr:DHHA1 domain-containing protein [Acidilobaceae archaeon]MCX8165516.1 DHHA1 domain-containing protein [Acidilobaceae archaeon]MDW7973943.1 DHHA1 domain-containing protein [Sulfolobales archaeon]